LPGSNHSKGITVASSPASINDEKDAAGQPLINSTRSKLAAQICGLVADGGLHAGLLCPGLIRLLFSAFSR
jgi:hypothetical protein